MFNKIIVRIKEDNLFKKVLLQVGTVGLVLKQKGQALKQAAGALHLRCQTAVGPVCQVLHSVPGVVEGGCSWSVRLMV